MTVRVLVTVGLPAVGLLDAGPAAAAQVTVKVNEGGIGAHTASLGGLHVTKIVMAGRMEAKVGDKGWEERGMVSLGCDASLYFREGQSQIMRKKHQSPGHHINRETHQQWKHAHHHSMQVPCSWPSLTSSNLMPARPLLGTMDGGQTSLVCAGGDRARAHGEHGATEAVGCNTALQHAAVIRPLITASSPLQSHAASPHPCTPCSPMQSQAPHQLCQHDYASP